MKRLPFTLKSIPWLAVALAGCYLPWVYHRTAGLTFNAIDLAEWVSLAPAVRGGSVPLLIPFLLRIALVGIALLCGVRAAIEERKWSRWLYMLLALALAATLLPPVDFFKGAFDDPNYRQQFALAVSTLIGLGIVMLVKRRASPNFRWTRITWAVSIVALLCAVSGNLLALNVVQSLKLEETLGGGMFLYGVGLALSVMAQAKTGPGDSSPA